ncbi:4644_t:CDS:2 [Funneliformis geosporum]|uniref:308_t:CDS:1 n=1 Tax=Funneliformis geosporum TaxID=1117311 RepID=A0A9W4SSM1_9GLOM|nr:4644_t:CDS:2 [Funneliformis geosporum]CAI2179774.1 308_t:CDS:2 [Funneliformis geosporum]
MTDKYPSRRQNQQRRRRANRAYRRRLRFFINQDILDRVENLPPQVVDDPSLDQFFNGFSFP